MFFFLALFVAGFILSAFFGPKTKIENAKAAGLSEFNFPRAKYGDPVPRMYGTVLARSPVVIGQSNFEAVPIKKKVKTGLFSSKKVITGYNYLTTLDLALALGPGVVYRRIYYGKHEIWNGCLYEAGCPNDFAVDLPDLLGGKENGGGIGGHITLYCGDFEQPQDAALAANLDPNVSAYPGIAHMVFTGTSGGAQDTGAGFYWGDSPNVQAISTEVSVFTNSLELDNPYHVMPNKLDANAIEILYDLYVNGWGNLDIDPARIDAEQWREIAIAVYDEGNGMSLIVDNATEGRELTKQILQQLNGIIFEDPSDGLYKLKLLRNDYVIADLPVYGPSEIAEIRTFDKKLWNETFNRLRLKFTDRENNYAQDAIATADDFANIRFQGKIRPSEIRMPGVYTAELANSLAARELSNVNVPLYKGEFVFNRSAIAIKPGDVFVFQWPEYGVEQIVMRARKFGLGTHDDGRIVVECAQDEFSADAVIIGPPVNSLHVQQDFSPNDVAELQVFELPYFLDQQAEFLTAEDRSRLAVFAKAPASFSLGYDAFLDLDPDVEAATLAPYSATAVLGQQIGRFVGIDDGLIASVVVNDFDGDTDLLTDNTEAETQAGAGLFAIGDEWFTFETATDNTGGSYTLNNVRRARIDTGWYAHNISDRVYFFDGQEGFFDTDTPQGSNVVYLTDRTATGSSDESTALKPEIVAVGRHTLPMPPDRLTIDGQRVTGTSLAAGDVISLDARERSPSAASLAFEDDPAGTAEAGTLYKIGFELDGVVTDVADDQTLPYDLTVTEAMTGAPVFLLWAKLDGAYSHSPASIPAFVGDNDFMTTEDEVLFATEDDELFTTES